MEKWELAKARLYKRPALATLGWQEVYDGLTVISNDCEESRWLDEDELGELLGDEELAFEFKIAVGDLGAKADELQQALGELEYDDDLEQAYNDCTVALLGSRYSLVGYDSYEEDYFALTGYNANLAQTEAGKRLMRKTKAEMLSSIGQCMGILLAYYDLRNSYDNLTGVFEVIKGSQRQLLQQIKEIEAAYEQAAETGFLGPEAESFDRLLFGLPERMWVE